MMDRTDRHFRVLMRCITRHTLLYTEMVTTGAVLHGDPNRHLDFDPIEHPISLQLGGDSPRDMAACAKMAHEWGYDEVNLNIGCPSDRVQNGNFGVCLMGDPERVRDCVTAMKEASPVPVTVKHRIGFDDQDAYEDMLHFVDIVNQARPTRFTVHARKAWLKGLSPKENRNIPPLRHEDVYRLKRERPQLQIETNGGIKTLDEAEEHLKHVDAVMIGRAAYDTPWVFADVDRRFYPELHAADPHTPDRREVVHSMLAYLERQEQDRVRPVARHMLTLFMGQPGAKKWRRHISENVFKANATPEVLLDALAHIPDLRT
jgi:tRNA-dihydrouridine synthase A